MDCPSPLKEPPRSLTTTLAPHEPKKVAYALPNPPPAPVMTTVWPSKRSSDISHKPKNVFLCRWNIERHRAYRKNHISTPTMQSILREGYLNSKSLLRFTSAEGAPDLTEAPTSFPSRLHMPLEFFMCLKLWRLRVAFSMYEYFGQSVWLRCSTMFCRLSWLKLRLTQGQAPQSLSLWPSMAYKAQERRHW